jgi:hypothetical protein
MKLVIKFPTRNRPLKFIKTLDKYIRFMDDKTNVVIVTCDLNDTSMNNNDIREFILQYDNVKVFYGDNKTKIEAVNADLTNVEFDIVLLASDDMIPVVKGFDTIIKSKMQEFYPDTDGILWFNDGFSGCKLNTLSIIGKKYYDRFGYIYYPEYKSVYCDNEFMEVGNLLKKQIYFSDVIIKHEHPDWGYGINDAIHQANQLNSQHDSNLYNKRKLVNFTL